MDPRVESALRRACDQLGLNGEHVVRVVLENLKAGGKLHAAVKVSKKALAELPAKS